jgi:hypothetical protein
MRPLAALSAVLLATTLALTTQEARADIRPGFFTDAEIGSTSQNFKVFYNRDLAIQKTSETGILLGANLGLTLGPIGVGARARLAPLSPFTYTHLGGLVRVYPLQLLTAELFVEGAFGPTWVSNFDTSAVAPAVSASAGDITLHGFTASLGFGGSVKLGAFSLGGLLAVETVALSRDAIAPPPGAVDPLRSDPLYAKSGAGTGLGFSAVILVGARL